MTNIYLKLAGNLLDMRLNHQEVDFYEFLSLKVRKISTSQYHVVEETHGIELIWDPATGLFITLSEDYRNNLEGLAGNYDGSATSEFVSSVGIPETDSCIFGNSFKMDPFCKGESLVMSHYDS